MDFRGIGGIAFAGTVLIGNAFLVLPAKPLGGAQFSEIVSY
jgi:hypothetical protein